MGEKEKIVVYTDGGARGNPGPAAIGIIVQDAQGSLIKEYAESIGEATNNIAEYTAALIALKKIKQLFGKDRAKKLIVDFRMDSELVVRQMTRRYKIKEPDLVPLFVELWNLSQDFGEVSFSHITREKNRAADRLVNQVLDRGGQRLF